jgi:hypothetical protein
MQGKNIEVKTEELNQLLNISKQIESHAQINHCKSSFKGIEKVLFTKTLIYEYSQKAFNPT